ncbi:MAG: FIST C-terminal domain-containing protein [Magnetospirillum sp.]
MRPLFVSAHAVAEHWGLAAKACLERLEAAQGNANLGILYVTETFAADLQSILTFLRETTRVETWVGAAVPGLCAGAQEIRDGGAMAVLLGTFPENDFQVFSSADAADFTARLGAWANAHGPAVALVHADPRHPGLPVLLETLADGIGFLVGGLVSLADHPTQVAKTVMPGAVSGLLLGASVSVVTGLTQGCTPIGPVHVVGEGWDNVIANLDGRPAIDVFKADAGELIARDPSRAAGYIHVALPVEGSDRGDYSVRTLLGLDPAKGWLAVGDEITVGQKVLFVRRDPAAAQTDLDRMLADIHRRLDGRPPLAALYVTCIGRGEHMFGERGAELSQIRQSLGQSVPLIGFFANGEISGQRLYGYTGVLSVICGDKP